MNFTSSNPVRAIIASKAIGLIKTLKPIKPEKINILPLEFVIGWHIMKYNAKTNTNVNNNSGDKLMLDM